MAKHLDGTLVPRSLIRKLAFSGQLILYMVTQFAQVRAQGQVRFIESKLQKAEEIWRGGQAEHLDRKISRIKT